MNKLDESQQQEIRSLQVKVDTYQQDPTICADLTLEQCTSLAKLQTIYNILNNKPLTTVQPMYNNICKGVRDEMKQFYSIYENMEAEQLYQDYIREYKAQTVFLNF
jgi:hypothetical protein